MKKQPWKMARKDAVDWMSTAVEGGISYWMNESCTNVTVERSKDFGEGDPATWEYLSVSFQDEDGNDLIVTVDKMVEESTEYLYWLIENHPRRIPNFVQSTDESNFDAEDADCYFQWLAFGDYVYG